MPIEPASQINLLNNLHLILSGLTGLMEIVNDGSIPFNRQTLETAVAKTTILVHNTIKAGNEAPASMSIKQNGKVKVKRDPLAPKQPMTSYLLFCNEARTHLKKDNPHMSQRVMAVEMGKLWKLVGVEERKQYDIEAQARRDQYKVELSLYRGRKGIQASNDTTAVAAACDEEDIPPDRYLDFDWRKEQAEFDAKSTYHQGGTKRSREE